jgi:hypothetical protein
VQALSAGMRAAGERFAVEVIMAFLVRAMNAQPSLPPISAEIRL